MSDKEWPQCNRAITGSSVRRTNRAVRLACLAHFKLQTILLYIGLCSFFDVKAARTGDSEEWRLTLRTSLSGTFLNSARFSYATEGALFISAHLSTDAVSALRNLAPKHARKHEARPPRVKLKEFRLDSNDCGFIWAGVSNMVSYKTNVWYNLSCL